MFYLTMHSTHFILCCYMESIKIVKDYPVATTLSDLQQWIFNMHQLTDRRVYTTTFVTPVVEHWLE